MRWPFDRITYSTLCTRAGEPTSPAAPSDRFCRGARRQIARAVKDWNEARVGWHFERGPAADGRADLVIQITPAVRKDRRCLGRTIPGWRSIGTFVTVFGDCSRSELLLGVAHEMGHSLGLATTRRGCAVMAPDYTGSGRRIRPIGCPPGKNYLSHPIQRDDRRGARRIYARLFTSPRRLCDPVGEQPVFADTTSCRHEYDCRGLAGENVADPDASGDVSGREENAVQADIVKRCPSVLKVVRVPPGGADRDRSARTADHCPLRGADHYAGTTSQGRTIRFDTRRRSVACFAFSARFDCSDGSYHYVDVILAHGQPGNVDSPGPFPRFRLGRRGGFAPTFETPDETAQYELRGRVRAGAGHGSVNVFESLGLVAPDPYSHPSAGPNSYAPDPDGGIVCDTGSVDFDVDRQP